MKYKYIKRIFHPKHIIIGRIEKIEDDMIFYESICSLKGEYRHYKGVFNYKIPNIGRFKFISKEEVFMEML